MKATYQQLILKQPALVNASLMFALVSAVLVVLWFIDNQTILGINRWIKPLKFSLSISVFLLTMAWVLSVLSIGMSEGALRWASYLMIGTMVVEQVLITVQAARGVPSHFNVSSGLNATIYSVMGTAIFINTLVLAYLLVKSISADLSLVPDLSPAMALALRYGLLLLVLGSLQGMYMSATGNSIVGGPHDGPSLPFLNWSTQFGDLRIAHFIALHGIQVLLLLAFALQGMGVAANWPVHLVAVGVLVLTTLAQLQAMAGKAVVG